MHKSQRYVFPILQLPKSHSTLINVQQNDFTVLVFFGLEKQELKKALKSLATLSRISISQTVCTPDKPLRIVGGSSNIQKCSISPFLATTQRHFGGRVGFGDDSIIWLTTSSVRMGSIPSVCVRVHFSAGYSPPSGTWNACHFEGGRAEQKEKFNLRCGAKPLPWSCSVISERLCSQLQMLMQRVVDVCSVQACAHENGKLFLC